VRFTDLLDRLVVYPDRMKKNLEATGGLIYSQRLMTELIDAGMGETRDDIYRHVQDIAQRALGGQGNFAELVKQDQGINSFLARDTINEIFDPDWYVRFTDLIFDRVFS
jgi:adenylosuccinate lyase